MLQYSKWLREVHRGDRKKIIILVEPLSRKRTGSRGIKHNKTANERSDYGRGPFPFPAINFPRMLPDYINNRHTDTHYTYGFVCTTLMPRFRLTVQCFLLKCELVECNVFGIDYKFQVEKKEMTALKEIV